MSVQAAIILNEHSGTAPSAEDLRKALKEARFEADVHGISRSHPVDRMTDELAERYPILVAAGGDGTVSTVAAAAVRHERTFGVIPAGTLNHFARDAGIPFGLPEALACLRAGHTRTLDAGLLNDFLFINNASIGAYPRMVWERNRVRRKGLPRPIALSFAVLRTWLDLRSMTMRLLIDGVEAVRRSPFLFVGNSAYDLDGMDMGHRPTMTDGRLSLYVSPDAGRLDALTLPVRALMGTLDEHEKFESWTAQSISVEPARKRIVVALDGELKTMSAPLRFRVARNALRTIVPAPREVEAPDTGPRGASAATK